MHLRKVRFTSFRLTGWTLCAGLGLALSAAEAAPVEFVWEAEIQTLFFQMGDNLDAGVSVGDTIRGTWSYDGITDFNPDPDKTQAQDGIMRMTAEIGALTVEFGSTVDPNSPLSTTGISGYIVDNNDIGSLTLSDFSARMLDNDANTDLDDDRNYVDAVPGASPLPILLNGLEAESGIAQANIEITAVPAGFFGADALLNETVDIDEVFNGFLDIELTETPNGSNALSFRSTLTSFRLATDPVPELTPVPLPAAALLLLGGLGLLAMAGRRP